MGIHKVVAAALFAALMAGCTTSETVTKSEYDDLLKEYQELKESQKTNFKQIENQAETITEALRSLSEISVKTTTLKLDVETGRAKASQADQIMTKISDIKDELSRLERSLASKGREARKLQETINSLKSVIEQKEKEVEELRAIISDKNDTIIRQSATIKDQQETISVKEIEIEEALRRQTELIFEAAQRFEEISGMEIMVRGKNDKAKVEAFKEDIRQSAIEYYKVAASRGHEGAKARLAQ